MNDYALSEIMRRLDRLASVATITELDPANARAKVSFGGDAESDWLPFSTGAAGAVQVWMPPTVGTQVLVISPGGDTSSAIIGPALYSNAGPAPSDLVGAVQINMPGISISLEGGVATIELTTVNIKGDIIVDGDVIASGISLVDHIHSGVIAGPDKTGLPE